MMTKAEISDLRSLHQRVIVCAMDSEKAATALVLAQAQLETFLWNQQHGKDSTGEPRS